MKLRSLVVAAAILLVSPLAASAAHWSIDTSHSNVGFSVRHLVTPVPGRFTDFTGTIVYNADDLSKSSVELTVQATSVDTANDQRDGHLRSGDFFAVEEHPTVTFKSTKVSGSGTSLEVTGDFTMRGVTKSITVPVEVLGVMGKKAGFSTQFVIDRKEYGVSWNRLLDQGGAILGDEVKIQIDIEADLQEEDGAAKG
ncbi:MAG: YceI family protein [Acidobacteriota bacterium]